ncbi:MAG: hypothetical protein OEZ03_13865, partial [Alphaproteobacteria bacterium]|nr:hypothetical protein [Alphaproteobacteria bacterium]
MMIYKRKGFGLTLALAFVLAGCMGSGGGGGAGGPTIDMTAVGSGGGTSEADAYLLPGTMPAGTNGDMKDYFAQGGYWQVGYSKLQKDVFTNASYRSTFGSMYYNADADQWVLYVNSAPYTLSDNGAGIYESSSGCYLSTSACTAVDQYDDATKDMYGTFANAMHYDGSYKASFITAHYGMLTADMPAGSATFNGVFEGAANDQTTFYAAT